MLDENYRIRLYKKGDFPDIRELWKLTGLGNEERGDNEKVIERSIDMGGRFHVLEYLPENRIIGSSWTTFDGRRLHLHHLGIHPDHQHKGLARALTAESLKHAKETGIQIKLEVHQSNLRAISLYRDFGFKYLGDYDVYIIRHPNSKTLPDKY